MQRGKKSKTQSRRRRLQSPKVQVFSEMYHYHVGMSAGSHFGTFSSRIPCKPEICVPAPPCSSRICDFPSSTSPSFPSVCLFNGNQRAKVRTAWPPLTLLYSKLHTENRRRDSHPPSPPPRACRVFRLIRAHQKGENSFPV